MSTLRVDRIEPYLSSSVSIEGAIQANAATTGSNTFIGDQNIQGTITASIAEGFALVGGVGNVSTLVATSSFGGGGTINTGSFATTGSNTFVGKQIIDGNQNGIALTGSQSYIDLSGFNSHISMYSGTGSIRFYTGSADGDGTSNIDTWVNMQVNPSNGALAISAFPSNNHFIDFDVATTSSVFDAPIRGFGGNLRIGSNTTITGSLTISGSANNDLTIQGRQLITGPTTGQTPQLQISASSHNNTIGQRVLQIAKPGFDYPLFLSQYTDQSSSILLNFTENLSATASYTVGVFDNAFTQDVELLLETTTTNGVQFKDIRSDTGVYTTFLKIAPNGGTNPPLEFKRSAEVTGSVSISDVLQLAQKDPLPTGAVGQLAVSASNLYYNNGATWTQIN